MKVAFRTPVYVFSQTFSWYQLVPINFQILTTIIREK